MNQQTQDTTARVSTLILAMIGVLLAVAENIKHIPALADYSNYATAFIGIAVAVKQVLMMIQPPSKNP